MSVKTTQKREPTKNVL